jgi:hypothetical protein
MSQAGSFGGGGGASTVVTLTGNSGGPISPIAGNINVVGDTTTINVAGAGNTLTISAMTNMAFRYTNVAVTPYVVLATDYYLSVDTSALAITVQLPNAPTTNRLFVIKDRTGTAGTRNITVTTVGGAVLIDGAATFIMNTNYQAVNFVFNGSTYEAF